MIYVSTFTNTETNDCLGPESFIISPGSWKFKFWK